MLPFQVILFDVGGVLLTNSWDVKERAQAAANFHIDQADFQARHAEVSDQWERGGISMATYLDVAVFHEPRNFSRDEFIACMFEQSKLLPNGALGILKELAASGHYLIGALNNEARELNDYRFETFGLREYFERGAHVLLSRPAQAGPRDLPARHRYCGRPSGAHSVH